MSDSLAIILIEEIQNINENIGFIALFLLILIIGKVIKTIIFQERVT